MQGEIDECCQLQGCPLRVSGPALRRAWGRRVAVGPLPRVPGERIRFVVVILAGDAELSPGPVRPRRSPR
eukprot:11168331-Lingulodinium_polyedra.AAC.1